MGNVVIRSAGEGPLLQIGPTMNWIKLAATESGGHVGAMEMELSPGFAGPPLHRHNEIDHVWYVLAGDVDIVVDEQRHTLSRGDFAYVPHGTPHAFANLGNASARLLEVDTPRTLDAYFSELATTFPADARIDQAGVADIQCRHDTIPLLAR